jgi:hypothetical protein
MAPLKSPLKFWAEILDAARIQKTQFDRACASPGQAQAALLSQILGPNAQTRFGREHRFSEISSADEFRSRVPIRSYEDFRRWIDELVAGKSNILTREPVIAFEETGGSTSGGKLIPYTASSLLAFRAAVLPWLSDLADRRPRAFAGKAYVAISPATRVPRTIGAIPVGLPSEGAYLGADLIPAFLNVLATPPWVAAISDMKHWRHATLASLLACPDLTIVSIWSPTFFIGLLEALPVLAEPLLKTLRDGTGQFARCPADAPLLPCDAARLRVIEKAIARAPIDTPLIWPNLDTVSAWADGASRSYARQLQNMLPHAVLQPKGLLATEGAVTTPCSASGSLIWPVPALTSAFLEFIDEAGASRLCTQLRAGESYRVVMTNAGGFYRYDLGDRLRCHGYDGLVPLLEFLGRDIASDLVGEKLSEHFVGEALAVVDGPACLAPRPASVPHYELLVETRHSVSLQHTAAQVEDRLRANPQYDYARRMGQLAPLTVQPVDRLLDRYVAHETKRGRRFADIKPPTLLRDAAAYATLTNQVDCDN